MTNINLVDQLISFWQLNLLPVCVAMTKPNPLPCTYVVNTAHLVTWRSHTKFQNFWSKGLAVMPTYIQNTYKLTYIYIFYIYKRIYCLSVCLLVGWLVCRSVCQSVGRSVGWSVSRLVGQSVGRSNCLFVPSFWSNLLIDFSDIWLDHRFRPNLKHKLKVWKMVTMVMKIATQKKRHFGQKIYGNTDLKCDMHTKVDSGNYMGWVQPGHTSFIV